MSVIHVNFKVYSTAFHIRKALKDLEQHDILGFDTETKGLYSKPERKLAEQQLKDENLPLSDRRICQLVANNSGLSFPSLVAVTHFVFGLSESESVIFISTNPQTELMIWNWVAQHPGLLIIHNTLFDLKIMYNRVRCFPQNYEDSALLAKTYINNADSWKAKIGLKDLVGEYYPPHWALYDKYEPDDLKDPGFLEYTAIDGAANMKLWGLIQEHANE